MWSDVGIVKVLWCRARAICVNGLDECVFDDALFRRAERALSNLVAYLRELGAKLYAKHYHYCDRTETEHVSKTCSVIYVDDFELARAGSIGMCACNSEPCCEKLSGILGLVEYYSITFICINGNTVLNLPYTVPSSVNTTLRDVIKAVLSRPRRVLYSPPRSLKTEIGVLSLEPEVMYFVVDDHVNERVEVEPEVYEKVRVLAELLDLNYKEICRSRVFLDKDRGFRAVIRRELRLRVAVEDIIRIAAQLTR